MKTDGRKKTKHDELTELVSHLYAAFEDPKGWEVDGLLSDAAHEINGMRRIIREVPKLIEDVRAVAIIVRETASPVSIVAADLYERLQKIEATLMGWQGKPE